MIRIGTRGSGLALAQARQAEELLQSAGYETEIVVVKTRGDKDLSTPLTQLGKGTFTDEFQRLLRAGEIDVAVHSAKDLPLAEEYDDFYALPRASACDALVYRKGAVLKTIGTGSLRRIAQGREFFPESEFLPIRGNVDTRLKKLVSGELDGLILAEAGLDRLGVSQDENIGIRSLPPERFVPAACQGIIAVQGEAGRSLGDRAAYEAAKIERRTARILGADCKSAVGIYYDGKRLFIFQEGKRVTLEYAGEETFRVLRERL